MVQFNVQVFNTPGVQPVVFSVVYSFALLLSTGQALDVAGYDKWSSSEPANRTSAEHKDGQYCGSVMRSGMFSSVWCNQPTPFICEKAPESLISEDDL